MQTELSQPASLPERTHAAFEAAPPSSVGERVQRYFETSGFSRWTAIYGTGEIPPIWRVIRDGHQQSLDQVLAWIAGDESITALDAGCGTGNLAIQLAERGYDVDAFDVSAPMIHFAKYINSGRTRKTPPNFMVGDIACVEGQNRSYDLVCCLDVLFHYPFEEATAMFERLTNLSDGKLIASFALRTWANDFWMAVGKKFHSKNRMTHLYMYSFSEVKEALAKMGFEITRTRRVKFFFYDSFVFEAVRR